MKIKLLAWNQQEVFNVFINGQEANVSACPGHFCSSDPTVLVDGGSMAVSWKLGLPQLVKICKNEKKISRSKIDIWIFSIWNLNNCAWIFGIWTETNIN